jgi:DNA-binding NarL/FixJ family response regulator
MINIIIADDHEIFLEGLISLLEAQDNIRIVGKANTGKGVIPLLEAHEDVDIAVLDVSMPEMDGTETAKIIKKHFPKVKILILTMYKEIGIIKRILEAGADGYIIKNKGSEELITALEMIHAGGNHFGAEVTEALVKSVQSKHIVGEIKLTKREKDVLKLIALGDSSKVISEKLYIAVTTVNTHRKNLIEKTGVRNSKELIRYAIENGYA